MLQLFTQVSGAEPVYHAELITGVNVLSCSSGTDGVSKRFNYKTLASAFANY